MIYLLLGSDDFSKKEFVSELSKGSDIFYFSTDADKDYRLASELAKAAMNSSLFEKKKIIKAVGVLGKIDPVALIASLKGSQYDIVFIEEKFDKRKTENKKILADKAVKVIEFPMPAGKELEKWIGQRSKVHKVTFSSAGLQAFIKRIGADQQPEFGSSQAYDLWQVDSEIKKLSLFASAAEINPEDVHALVPERIEENVFKITNAIADKDKDKTMKRLRDYLENSPAADEKTKIIGLSAVLAEQFRGILAVLKMLEERKSDSEISRVCGFSAGKVFVYKKLAKSFNAQKILSFLSKLELLDEEIKTSKSPAGLQFLMIISALL